MKKYKLIKWYPSLPEYWKSKDVTAVEVRDHNTYDLKIDGKIEQPLYEDEVENNPEFWQEVTEKDKDYEILSLISPTSTVIKNITNENCIKSLINQSFSIHSVKRVSDGEVFTVGDSITSPYFFPLGEVRKIEGFDINRKDGHIVEQSGGWSPLNGLKKAKPILFKTEEGVNIFEGDKYWWVTKNNEIYTATAKRYSGNPENKQFSKKEAAEEYILMNAPRLSINNIHDLLKEFWEGGKINTGQYVDLKELIVEKAK